MTAVKTDETQAGKTKVAQTPALPPDHALIKAMSVEQLGDILKFAGYRVTPLEKNGRVQLWSASQGLGFAVQFGNPGAEADTYIDYTFSCALQIQGELPSSMVSDWNNARRFARLAIRQQLLVMEMDMLVAGGVSRRHVLSTIELWDRLMQEFLLHLRKRPAAEQAQAQAVAASAESSSKRAPDTQANP